MSTSSYPNDTRLNYDECSYEEKLKRTIGPGLYNLNVPDNDCDNCSQDINNDPAIRYQKYGPNTCTMDSAIDDSNELKGLNYKNTKCNTNGYLPNKYQKKSKCNINGTNNRDCFAPQESTRLSHPSNTLKGTGINRFQWLYNDPQEFAIERFDRIPVNDRMLCKDNHIPLIELPNDDYEVLPDSKNLDINPSDNINTWAKGLATHRYAPGNPDGVMNYNFACK
tara:strand:- start:1966 stop:2634 length:669 start_codon:yes stop_codon:yes gene_type:complete